MSILGRLSNLVKSNLNAAVDKLSDPAKEVDLLIEEMEEEIKKLRVELRDQIVQEKLSQKRVDEAYRNVQKWQEHAERAVRAGDDDLAKEALIRQSEAEKKLEATESALAEHSRLVAKMHADLKGGEAKLVEVKGKKETLKHRARTAQKQAAAGTGGGTAFDRFQHLVAEIEDKEEQAAAMAEIEPVIGAVVQEERDRQTNDRFDRLLAASPGSGGAGPATARSPKDAEMDARLAALKAKLDKNPEGD
jgi:phage shock protein A